MLRCAQRFSRLYRPSQTYRHCSTIPPKDSNQAKKQLDREDVEDPKDELTLLYDAVFLQVPKHGWTDTAISEAVKELGWSIAATRMIARGPVQVAEEFVTRCNKRLAVQLNESADKEEHGESDGASVTKAIYAIRERINMIEPFHSSWSKALALQAIPRNSPKALRSSALMIDEIAHFSGYRQPNISWYTDRAVLGLAYHSTELYWLTDRSEGREDTWRFLESRLKDSHKARIRASGAYNNLMAFSDATISSISSLIRSTRRSY